MRSQQHIPPPPSVVSQFPPQYFPEAQEGPIKNKISLRPEELQFTLKALTAAGKELTEFLKAFPSDVVAQLSQEVSG